MLTSHLSQVISENLGFDATGSQQSAIDKLSSFIVEYEKHQILIINGYAGTGKTTLMNALVKTLDRFKTHSLLLAPTGRAAKVLSQYTQKPAFTIHKKIYRQKSSSDGFGNFSVDFNPFSHTLIIVDEASMISNQNMDSGIFGSGRLLDDLLEYTFSGKDCKLILVGDVAQLPPVGLNLSPALDQKAIEAYGYSTDFVALTDVVRQAKNSGILFNATTLRKMINQEIAGPPNFETAPFTDFVALSGEDLLESISSAYDRMGTEETMIICRSNKRANLFNQGIRNQILGRESELSAGDLLMVVKNNYYWLPKDIDAGGFIANGDILEVKKVLRYQDLYGLRFADLVVSIKDYNLAEIEVKIMMNTLSIDGPSLTENQNKDFFNQVAEDYADRGSKARIYQAMKQDPFFNALQVKFAFAITCHKAQGGQWKSVYIDQGYINENTMDIEYLRWLYTAITRGSDKVYLINFPSNFFQE